ncbi:MAG: nucleotide exchange factor GrpE [Eubacteriaceae bacterium]|jgi:molecular chaperone GrpE|nr:nucleotide exchange factor GrpE [Eubacteriaceae bacterium]
MTTNQTTNTDAEEKAPDTEQAEEEIKEEPETEEADETEAEEEQAEEPEAQEEKKETEDEDLNTKYLRLMADFQNFKKRAQKQRSETLAYANAEIVGQLLEVLDNFERALDRDVDEEEAGFKEGMRMVFDQLKGVLDKAGVEEIEALGTVFDPNFHNAVMTEDTDEYESGQVSGVMQKGYTLKGRVVRPAMVKVAN